MKKVSIILPVYNGEKNIATAIDSILSQTYGCFELIIVNDCSTDSSKEIIERYVKKDSRIRLINNTVNMKLPKSLNIGFSHAQGDYFTWTSDDNVLMQNTVEELVKGLEQNDAVGMVYSDYINIDAEGKELGVAELATPDRFPFSNPIGACFMYRKQVAEKIGEYDVSLFLAEDYDYWIRIYKEFEIMHITEKLYFYRRHSESLSATKKELVNAQTFRLLEKHFLFLYSLINNNTERYIFFDRLVELCPMYRKNILRKLFFEWKKTYYFFKKKQNMLKKFKKL